MNFNNKLVSVLMSCFNSENTVDDSIKSILNQTYNHIELLIIDDGSTDKSLQIIQELTKDYDWISFLQLNHKTKKRSIGAKIINAFNFDFPYSFIGFVG